MPSLFASPRASTSSPLQSAALRLTGAVAQRNGAAGTVTQLASA
ncbi:hypothetical protein [Streptomyces sp. NPDC051665]